MTTPVDHRDVAIIGAGNVGIAVAYYLVARHGLTRIALLDSGEPMALTSAQSGENYRNWWPDPVMTAFTDDSIELMEEIARASGNRIHMTRRGYTLATRTTDPSPLLEDLYRGYGAEASERIRVHDDPVSLGYRPAVFSDWETAPDGVDVLLDCSLIREHFPSFASDVAAVLHVRRAGDISAQQLGQFMLERVREAGGRVRRARVRRARVRAIEGDRPFVLRLDTPDGPAALRADRIVNAAGPFLPAVAEMVGESLPVECIFQQKIAFEDRQAAIPRTMPFSIDLDGQEIEWTSDEREVLTGSSEAAHLLAPMPGGVHCRPDGGDRGTWIKLGWAYNRTPGAPGEDSPLDPQFPDIVLRGASRLNPGLRAYIERLPRSVRHYGGYYTMTSENWPLIGPTRTEGAFVAGALSGFGTMGACASGALCAAWIAGSERPSYARELSLARYEDEALMSELASRSEKGVL